jgi:hypothetical protein
MSTRFTGFVGSGGGAAEGTFDSARLSTVRRLLRCITSVFVAGVAVVSWSSAASAKPVIDATVGVNGSIAAGKPIPIHLSIQADRLIKGTVQIDSDNFGNRTRAAVVPVEIAGGATKDLLIVVLQIQQMGPQGGSFRVTLTNGGTDVASIDVSGSMRTDQEQVGVLPQMLAKAKPPETATLTVDAGTARTASFDPGDLTVPGAVEVFDMLVATSADLTALPDPSRRELLGWIGRGGRLLVQATAGEQVPGLPSDWQPGAAGRVAAGRGEVDLVAAVGNWWEHLEPTPTRNWMEDSGFGFGFQGNSGPLPNSVAIDAGFSQAKVGWLAGFLGIYVFVVGPFVYLILKRMKRPGLLWSVVPALAVVFTGVAAVVGRSQQNGGRTGYATLVESSPGGSWAMNAVGALAGNGSYRTTLPDGWRVAQGTSMFFGNPNDQVGVTATATKDGLELSTPTGTGQFAMLYGFGPVPNPGSFEIVSAAEGDGIVSGTIKNTSNLPLVKVAVFSGFGATLIGDVAVGEQKPFRIDHVTSSPDMQRGPMDDARSNVWPEASGWNGQPKLDGPVNGALWGTYQMDNGSNAFRRGRITAVGWTRDQPPPFAGGGDMAGRTAVVQDVAVGAVGRLTAANIRTDIVRGFGVMDGPQGNLVTAYTLPPSDAVRTTPPRLQVRLDGGADRKVELWDGAAWRSLQLTTTYTDLPAEFIRDGRVYTRLVFNPQFGGPMSGTILLSEVAS